MAATHKTLADKAPYPEPAADQKRCVIFLEPKGDAEELNDYKVELIPGRVMDTDGINIVRLGGQMEEKTLEGWGYTYHVVTLAPGAMSTRMAMIGGPQATVRRFVALHTSDLCRYNSKLPLVVYVPKDAELHYRIWTANGGKEGSIAQEA